MGLYNEPLLKISFIQAPKTVSEKRRVRLKPQLSVPLLKFIEVNIAKTIKANQKHSFS